MKNKLYWFFVVTALFLFIEYPSFTQSTSQLVQDIEDGNLQGVKETIESGISVHTTGGRFNESLLNIAVMNGQVEIARFLIEKGADINKCTGIVDGMTPLDRAANFKELECAKLLVKKGADINKKPCGSFSGTPLTYSLSPNFYSDNDFYPVFLYLLKNGADVNSRDFGGTGYSALLLAITNYSCNKCVQELVKRGADVNLTIRDKTPIEYAIENFSIISNFNKEQHSEWAEAEIKIIEILLRNGARTDVKTKDGLNLIEVVNKKFETISYSSQPDIQDLGDPQKTIAIDENMQISEGKSSESEMVKFYLSKKKEILKLIEKYSKKN